MKHLILTIAFICIAFLSYSQEMKTKTPKVMKYQTEEKAKGKGTQTTKFVIIKDIRYDLLQGSKGGYYYVLKTDSGYTRKYVKIQ